MASDDEPAKATENIEVVAPKQSGNIVTAGRDIHQTVYHGVQPPSDADEASPLLVAHDDLKEFLHEGERMLVDFHTDRRPTYESVNGYIERVRTCAKRRVFNLSQKEWDRFEAPLEGEKEGELIMKKAELEDAGLMPSVIIDPYPTMGFDRLYIRVERLRELLAFMTGQYQEPAPLPTLPTPRERLVLRETGPQNVPPKREVIRERASKVIHTVETRIQTLTSLLDKDSNHLDTIAGYPAEFIHKATQDANFSDLFEIENELIQESLAICRETEWSAFLDLWQSLSALNREISEYNRTHLARPKNTILRRTVQTIPVNLEQARTQSTKPL
jgi:hypothetical protein